MNGMPPDCYFIRYVPIDLLQYKDEETEEWETWDWYRALRDDIRENGLACPLLVDMGDNPYNRFGRWGVRAGHHRLGACKSIGWTHIPCLIYGGRPLDTEMVGPIEHVKGIHRVWDLLRDGKVRLEHEMFWMNDPTLPETMKYPPNPEPYWPETP